jgi:hypothetical protein
MKPVCPGQIALEEHLGDARRLVLVEPSRPEQRRREVGQRLGRIDRIALAHGLLLPTPRPCPTRTLGRTPADCHESATRATPARRRAPRHCRGARLGRLSRQLRSFLGCLALRRIRSSFPRAAPGAAQSMRNAPASAPAPLRDGSPRPRLLWAMRPSGGFAAQRSLRNRSRTAPLRPATAGRLRLLWAVRPSGDFAAQCSLRNRSHIRSCVSRRQAGSGSCGRCACDLRLAARVTRATGPQTNTAILSVARLANGLLVDLGRAACSAGS